MSVDHAQRIAAFIARPTSEVLLAARLRGADDLLFDRGELEQAPRGPDAAAGDDGGARATGIATGEDLVVRIADLLRALGVAPDRDLHEDAVALAAPPSPVSRPRTYR